MPLLTSALSCITVVTVRCSCAYGPLLALETPHTWKPFPDVRAVVRDDTAATASLVAALPSADMRASGIVPPYRGSSWSPEVVNHEPTSGDDLTSSTVTSLTRLSASVGVAPGAVACTSNARTVTRVLSCAADAALAGAGAAMFFWWGRRSCKTAI